MRRCKLPAYNWRWRRHNTVPLSLIKSGDGVGPSPKKRGGAEPARPSCKSATGSRNRWRSNVRVLMSGDFGEDRPRETSKSLISI